MAKGPLTPLIQKLKKLVPEAKANMVVPGDAPARDVFGMDKYLTPASVEPVEAPASPKPKKVTPYDQGVKQYWDDTPVAEIPKIGNPLNQLGIQLTPEQLKEWQSKEENMTWTSKGHVPYDSPMDKFGSQWGTFAGSIPQMPGVLYEGFRQRGFGEPNFHLNSPGEIKQRKNNIDNSLKNILRLFGVGVKPNAAAGGGNPFASLFQSDRLNLPKQIGAILGMNPQQATSYRTQVNQTLPKIPVQPPATLPTPKVNTPYNQGLNTLAKVQPAAQKTVSAAVNPLQTGAEGLARLPAARNIGEGAGDVLDVVAGILQGSNMLHAGRGVAATAMQHPEWINNQVGGIGGTPAPAPVDKAKLQADVMAGKISPERANEILTGWQPGAKAKFDFAVMQNDYPTIKQMLPQVPEGYLQSRFGPEIYQKLLGAAARPAAAAIQPSPGYEQVSRGIYRAVRPKLLGLD